MAQGDIPTILLALLLFCLFNANSKLNKFEKLKEEK